MAPPAQGTWKQPFWTRSGSIDLWRVHFIGKIPYRPFVPLLQVSTVQTYLTYPFVLGWSLLEAMTAGCAIVASDTPPVREAIRTARPDAVRFLRRRRARGRGLRAACRPCGACPSRRGRPGRAAALRPAKRCLPRQIELLDRVAGLI